MAVMGEKIDGLIMKRTLGWKINCAGVDGRFDYFVAKLRAPVISSKSSGSSRDQMGVIMRQKIDSRLMKRALG